MKLQNFLLYCLAAGALFIGCGPKEEPQPSTPMLNVSPSEVKFEQNGGTVAVSVTSNRPWSIETDADWLNFSPANGAASDAAVSINVSALANTGNDRTASFKVKTEFDFRTISVTQPGAKGEDTTDKPSGNGTKESPYNPAGVVAYINTLAADTESPNVVYVTGKISEVGTTYEASGTYGNATFYISEDGSKSLTQFYVFQTYYLGNKKWKSGQTDIKVGDVVTVCGKVVNYKGNTPETVGKGASYVCTLNGKTEYGEGGQTGDKPEAKGTGTLEDPYNPSAAADAAAKLTWTDKDNYQTTDIVYVKGKISRIADKGTYTEGGSYGNASFYIVEDGTDFEFYVFRALYLGNKKFESGQTDIKVGDEVIICGKLMNYQGKTPETVAGGAFLYSLNGKSEGGGGQEGGEPGEPKGTGTLNDPYNPSAAAAAVAKLTWTDKDNYQTTDNVYVKGKISRIPDKGTYTEGGQYGNASFYIVEDGSEFEFYVYRALYLGNKKFEEGQTDIKVGDEVIIYGKLMNYKGNTPETVAGEAFLYSLNGKSEGGEGGGEETPAEEATVAQALAADKDAVLNVGPALVVAAASTGILIEQDGSMIYVYGGTATVGDMVTVKATRAEYSGTPQLSSPTVTVKSSGNKVTYPETAKDINSTFDSYSSTSREFVTFKGKLSISNDKYFNVTVDGASAVTGSLVKPVENISSYDGKEVTLKGYYLYHASQGKYLYIIATEINGTAITGKASGDGEQGGGGEATSSFSSNVTWTIGDAATDGKATVNGQADVPCLKLGTSSKVGSGTIKLPKGTTSVSFYGVAWKGAKTTTVTFKAGDKELFSQVVAANDGASGNSPYTMTVKDSDFYTKTFEALATDTVVTISSDLRSILFGINVK